jgi:hypothetical protein
VRIEVAGEPRAVRACWCRVCQYLGAGSGTVNAIFAAGDVSVAGEMVDYVSTAESGNVMHRRFCPVCGTALLSASEARPDLVVVRAGALDEREGLRPEMVIWTKEAPGWACFDALVPRVEGQPGPVR